jgi:hypothetical protein
MPPSLFPPDLHMNETDMRQSRCTKPPYLGLPPIQYILHFVLRGVGIKHGRRRHQSLNVVFTGVFVLRWCSNFVGSESGQKQSVKLLQNVVYNTN